jgi:hypothetical protein
MKRDDYYRYCYECECAGEIPLSYEGWLNETSIKTDESSVMNIFTHVLVIYDKGWVLRWEKKKDGKVYVVLLYLH